MNKSEGKCCCPCHMMPGILVALFGLSFLLKNAGVISDSLENWIWPSLLVLGGLSKLCASCFKCCGAGACEKK